MTISVDHFLDPVAVYIKRVKSSRTKCYAICLQCDFTFGSPEKPLSLNYVGRYAKNHTHATGHTTELIRISKHQYQPMTQQEYEAELAQRERRHRRHGY